MVYLEGCSLCPREECVFWLLFTGVFYVGLIKSDCFVTFMSSFSLLIFCLDGLDFFFKSQHVALYLFIFGCSGSSLLPAGFLYLWCVGFSLRWLLVAEHGL